MAAGRRKRPGNAPGVNSATPEQQQQRAARTEARRQVVVQMAASGLTMAEMAHYLSVSPTTVQSDLRALGPRVRRPRPGDPLPPDIMHARMEILRALRVEDRDTVNAIAGRRRGSRPRECAAEVASVLRALALAAARTAGAMDVSAASDDALVVVSQTTDPAEGAPASDRPPRDSTLNSAGSAGAGE